MVISTPPVVGPSTGTSLVMRGTGALISRSSEGKVSGGNKLEGAVTCSGLGTVVSCINGMLDTGSSADGGDMLLTHDMLIWSFRGNDKCEDAESMCMTGDGEGRKDEGCGVSRTEERRRRSS